MSELRVRADLDDVAGYRQGRSAEPSTGRTVYKVSSNENPHPPLPAVVEAVTAALLGVNRYPESAASALTARLAATLGVAGENIVFGAGSVESIAQLIRATSGPGDEVLYAWRSFEAYPLLVRGAGATPVQVPLAAGDRHDLDAMLAAITDRTSLVIVCNPNNPTGTTVTDAELRSFLDRVPAHVPVLVDEAYMHFDRGADAANGIAAFHDYPNVVVAHTFSKAHGLAGLRVGYGVGHPRVIAGLLKAVIPFGVTDLSQAAALTSLRHWDEVMARATVISGVRDDFAQALRSQGWDVPEAQGNFVWLPLGELSDAFEDACVEQAIAVRNLGDGVRISIGPRAALDRVLEIAADFRAAHFG